MNEWLALLDHTTATSLRTLVGLLLAMIFSFVVGSIFYFSNSFEGIVRPVLVAVYATPIIFVVPIISATMSPEASAYVCVALSAFYPLLSEWVHGLKRVNRNLLNVANSFGGKTLDVFTKVLMPAALSNLFVGLALAIPCAILGAMLAELGSPENGLGKYIVGLLQSARYEQLAALTLFISMASGGAYALAMHASRYFSKYSSESLDYSKAFARRMITGSNEFLYASLTFFGSVLFGILLWAVLSALSDVPLFVKGPLDLVYYLVTDPDSSINRKNLITAFSSTMGTWILGLICGLPIAYVLALSRHVFPRISYPISVISLIIQTIPIVVFVALLAIVFGRSELVTILMSICASVFAGYISLSESFAKLPRNSELVIFGLGGSRLQVLKYLSIPAANFSVVNAARLSAPKILLGIVMAEYLITYEGVGGLLFRSRGYYDFSMIWSLLISIAVLSTLLDQLLEKIESSILLKKNASFKF